ncbi:MAG: VacJ family lipoprotein [Caldimonas sp.]
MTKGSLWVGSTRWRVIGLAVLAAALAGCTTLRESRGGPGQRLDPWENWNRKVFNFNEDVDKAVLKPVATVYADVVPQPVRRGVSNFFSNFADAWSAINNMLQGKFEAGFEDATRVGVNTLFGLFGILDVASEMGLEHHYEDFGQTLGRYGVGAGAYLVLPILGPSSVRDAAVQPLDRLASPPAFFDGTKTQIGFSLLQIINTRASLLGATRVIDDISLDKYTFVRDAYLQRRRSLVFDGDAPETPAAPEAAASAAAGAAAGNVAPPAAATAASTPPLPGAAPATPSRAPASAPA